MFQRLTPSLDLLRDIDGEFLEAVSREIGWAYPLLYEQLKPLAPDFAELAAEEFRRRRWSAVNDVLLRCAARYGIPHQLMRLPYNGQFKLLLQIGRLTLIQEPILGFDDHPVTADYKRSLADAMAYNAQLELDLGDRPVRPEAWSGSALVALLHGPVGRKFTETDTQLGNLMLALPDAAYRQWIQRLDLHTVAMFGAGAGVPRLTPAQIEGVQRDQVSISPKRKNLFRDAE